MTRDQIEAVLKSASAKQEKGVGFVLPEGSNLTVHAAQDGASLSFSKIESAHFEGELLFAKSAKQVLALPVASVFAVAVEGVPGSARRAAGFAAS